MQITLQAARVNAGLTVREAAEKIGVNKNTISKWETGKSGISEENQDKLCAVYDIEREYIKELN